MSTEQYKKNKLELRSEKVRQRIGEIPQTLVICGIVIIVTITVVLVTILCLMPYPYSKGESILQHMLG